ncbi:DUF402 domain-containing protein [Paenibacillus sp. OV219]|uniref:DUF402 domain-containing protein n=1 Tax=Paenibacillus sp. OV219 TaxID=1884377 RepID=UPI0008B7FB54|nr:DUF402 domain-containing protein [Paenibacillus sp. OV219]SEN14408.1 protein associated with RNAses G and E [Paenibacillus sp. OV219]
MQLIRRITDSDWSGDTPKWLDTVSRYAARGVLFDSEWKVAMMHMTKLQLYKLPGGGVEEGEDPQSAFLREILEETGCIAEVIHELGYIEEHKVSNAFLQHSSCYAGKVVQHSTSISLTDEEIALGMQVEWMDIDAAVEIMKAALQQNVDESDRFMLLRDLTILEETAKWLSASVTIQARKYGDRPHYEWRTTLLERTDSHIFVLGHYGRKLKHFTKGKTFIVENWTIECFPFDFWFTVSADVINGKIAQYYCNISEPARMEGCMVTFVDLDIDLIYKRGKWEIVDEDEFVSHAAKFEYPPELIARVRQEVERLQERIALRQFPFDGSIERFIPCIPRDSA